MITLPRITTAILFFGILFSISACQSTSSPKIDRDVYLNQFLGKNTQYIRSRLDLKALGYQKMSQPIVSERELTYVVQRPVAIPLPVAQFPVAGTGAVPVPMQTSSANSYDYNLQCKITFHLKDNIAQDISYTGRTC